MGMRTTSSHLFVSLQRKREVQMKKGIMTKGIAATVLMATAVLMASCGSEGEVKTEFKRAVKDVSAKLTREADSPQCTVHLNIAYAVQDPKEAEKSKAAQVMNKTVMGRLLDMEEMTMVQAVDSFANKYVHDYQKNFAPLYREDKGDEGKRAWYEYRYKVDTETRAGRKGTVVYTATLEYYEGGAHGISQRLVMNFDEKTGLQVKLGDVFVPGYEGRLNELLLDALKDYADARSLNELHEKGYLYSMDMFAPENFILDEDEVIFVYNPFEIAPYTAGIIELHIDNDDLKEIAKKE